MEDVHEPPAVVGEVGLLNGEIEVGNDLNGFHKSSMLTRRAVHLNDRRRCENNVVNDNPEEIKIGLFFIELNQQNSSQKWIFIYTL